MCPDGFGTVPSKTEEEGQSEITTLGWMGTLYLLHKRIHKVQTKNYKLQLKLVPIFVRKIQNAAVFNTVLEGLAFYFV